MSEDEDLDRELRDRLDQLATELHAAQAQLDRINELLEDAVVERERQPLGDRDEFDRPLSDSEDVAHE